MKKTLLIGLLLMCFKVQAFSQTWNYQEFLGEITKEDGKTHVVYVYASWCGFCIESFPYLYELQQKHQADTTLRLWLLNTDREEAKWRWVMDRSVTGWRHAFCGDGADNKEFRSRGFEYTGIPSIFWLEGGANPKRIKSKLKFSEMLDERAAKADREASKANSAGK